MQAALPQKSANSWRVVVIDDHPFVRAGVKATLEGAGGIRVVGEAADGDEALAVVRQHVPDVVVLDLLLPHRNGIEVVRSLLEELPALKIVAYSMHDDPWWVQHALNAGAAGYVSKRSAESELLRAVQQVATGKHYLDRSLDEHHLPRGVRPRSPSSHCFGLSKREAEVLRRVALGEPVKHAAGSLKLSPRTFETYKARAMQKLQLRTRVDLMRFAAQCGWLHEPEALDEGAGAE
jgi:DNA-binding NarL/FixJ family response regulator